MKRVNIMNFARSFEPRDAHIESLLLDTTRKQLDLVNKLGVDATFLLQYDVLCNEDFVKMIKERAGESIELGLWYEIVEPLTSACGLPYESERGWKWDWHIKPGFSVSYANFERDRLIDEAMRKFREVFGEFPRTVGSWLLDTHTVNHLADNYDLDAVCYCRDQVNTDAYTLVGGYFNQAYYPSRNNYFTPAQSAEAQNKLPAFRLLGPDPIHNYDNEKYASESVTRGPYTMEVAIKKVGGGEESVVDWYLENYFNNESLGFAYMQIGQENSFATYDIIEPLRMQIEKIKKLPNVKIEKMCDTARAFKERYATTPATSVSALNNWDSVDCQSVYYDSAFYTANLMRVDSEIFIRSLYLFDDRLTDRYDDTTCATFDAIYENLPIVDTLYQKGDSDGGVGIILDSDASAVKAIKTGDGELTVVWGDKSVIFKERSIIINNCKLNFAYSMNNTKISHSDDSIYFEYKGVKYSLKVNGGRISKLDGQLGIEGGALTLTPTKGE